MTGKLYGCVRYSGRFHPEIVIAGDGTETLLWRGGSYWDVHTAREVLAEAVALVGLCFWPPGGLNDNGRELGVSPWVLQAAAYTPEQIRAAFHPRCSGCGNEIDPTTCWCGSEIPHDAYNEHDAVPMGCDCARSTS